jgi:hypothetical protein
MLKLRAEEEDKIREDRIIKLLCFMNLKHFNFFFIGSVLYFMNTCHFKKHMDIPLNPEFSINKYD